AAADEPVVVDDDDADTWRPHWSSHGSQDCTANEPSVPGPCSSAPPASATRSASPTSPNPPPGVAGSCSSRAGGGPLRTSIVRSPPGPPARWTATRLPGACLRALVSASWTTRYPVRDVVAGSVARAESSPPGSALVSREVS